MKVTIIKNKFVEIMLINKMSHFNEYVRRTVMVFIAFMLSLNVLAQDKKKEPEIEQAEKQLIRKGNDFYKKGNFVDAEVQYKKALEQNPNYEKANYNLGNAIYQQNRFKEALPMYELSAKTTEHIFTKAESFHNTGNVMMKAKQYAPAIEAYKNSLRNNSQDDETRYNLALAQKLLKKEQQNQNNKDKNKDQNKDNKDKKDQKNKDDQGKDKDKDKKGDGDDKNKNKEQNGDKDKQKQEPKQQQNKLTPQQVKQLLEAMNNEENKTQKKVNAKKAKGRKVKQEKDW